MLMLMLMLMPMPMLMLIVAHSALQGVTRGEWERQERLAARMACDAWPSECFNNNTVRPTVTCHMSLLLLLLLLLPAACCFCWCQWWSSCTLLLALAVLCGTHSSVR